MKKTPQEKIEYFYELGISHRFFTTAKLIFENQLPEWALFDALCNCSFYAGKQSKKKPVYAIGWRYGKIPESRCSYNYIEYNVENGLYMIEVFCEGETFRTQKISAAHGNPIIWCEGYLNTVDRGSEGEPLLIYPEEIEKPNFI